jgi:ABC-type multidrug transport system ATPase subunit
MLEFFNLSIVYNSRGHGGVKIPYLKCLDQGVCAIIGRNGAGKTSLLSLLAPDDLPHMSQLKTIHASVFHWLFSWKGNHLTDEQAVQLIRDLSDKFDFSMKLEQPVSSLSEGEAERIFVSAKFLHAEKRIALDEPFRSTDPLHIEKLLDEVKELAKNRELKIFWITHHLDHLYQFADECVFLSAGKILRQGTPQELFQYPGSLEVAQFMGHQNFLTLEVKASQGVPCLWHEELGLIMHTKKLNLELGQTVVTSVSEYGLDIEEKQENSLKLSVSIVVERPFINGDKAQIRIQSKNITFKKSILIDQIERWLMTENVYLHPDYIKMICRL